MPPSSPKQFNLLRGINHPQNRLIRLQKKAQSRDKGPFINDQASAPIVAPLIVRSEKPDAYEVGIKTSLLNRFNLNIALFHTKTKNFQTTIFIPPEVSGTAVASFFQGNAPYAITQGVDIGLTGNITDNLSINASLLYNNAHFNKGFTVRCTFGPCLARRQLPYAPRWKGSFSAEYRRDIAGGVEGYLQSDFSYSSSYPFGPTPQDAESGSRYVLGARAGLRLADDQYGLSVFCRNCFDKRYPLSVRFPYSVGTITNATSQYLGLSSYRVIGLSLDAKF